MAHSFVPTYWIRSKSVPLHAGYSSESRQARQRNGCVRSRDCYTWRDHCIQPLGIFTQGENPDQEDCHTGCRWRSAQHASNLPLPGRHRILGCCRVVQCLGSGSNPDGCSVFMGWKCGWCIMLAGFQKKTLRFGQQGHGWWVEEV